MLISSWLPQYQDIIEGAIFDFFDTRYTRSSGVEKVYEEALRYAVEGGGKRLRPILAMVTYEYSAGVQMDFWKTQSGQKILRALVGIELIHCYTLVHDDLPSMDNDELRRGKPTVWKEYGEPMALLVGDTLQTMGWELLASSDNIQVVTLMTRALGDIGVARGQVRDTFLRHDTLMLDELLRIHDEKTGIFIAACLLVGGVLGGGDDTLAHNFNILGLLLGRAFQIQDDILDAEGDTATMGKKSKKDQALGKGIVSLMGLEESKEILRVLEGSMLALTKEMTDARFTEIVEFVVHRTR